MLFAGVAGFFVLACTITSAAGSDAYRDGKGFFTFTPPGGWILQEFRDEPRNKVQCQSPDGEAVIGIIVRPREGTFQDVIEGQEGFLNTQRKFFPENKYIMSDTFVCGSKASKIEMEAPGGMKQDIYVFLSGDLYFNITYAAVSAKAFEEHWEEVSDAFSSLRVNYPG